MLQYNPTVSGSLSVTGNIQATQGITGSFSGSIAGLPTDTLAFSSSLSTRITNTESTASAYVSTSGSLSTRVTAAEATSSAYVTASGSLSTRVTATEATASAYVTASGSLSTRTTNSENYIAAINAKTGSYATTGSNYFIGTQVVTGSVYISSDLVVQGSSSLQNITASAVSIGTNTVILNTSTPILRFGGISVQDSGSAQGRSGSLFWDSLNDHWIYVVPSGSNEGYNSAMLMNGPKNTGSLGNEAGLTTDYIPVSQGEDHITDSIIFQSGSRFIGIGTSNPQSKLHISGSIKVTDNPGVDYIGFGAGGSSAKYAYITSTTEGSQKVGLAIYTTSDAGTSNQERIRITDSGYVGIGITNPSGLLHLAAPTGAGSSTQLIFDRLGGYGSYYVNYAYESTYYTNGSTLEFRAGNSLTQLRLASNNAYTSGSIQLLGGNVGIGVTSPTRTLHINSASDTRLAITDDTIGTTSGDGTYYRQSGVNAYIVNQENGTFQIGTNNSYFLTALTSGNVGIGTTTPAKKLDVYDSNGNATAQIKLRNAGSTPAAYLGAFSGNLYLSAGGTYDSGWTTDGTNGIANIVMETSNGGSAIAFGTAASNTSPAERMRIMASGNVGIGTTSPYTTAKLQVRTTTNINLAFQTGTLDSSGIKLNAFNDAADTNVPMELNGSTLYFKANESERMRITGGAGNDLIIGYAGGNPYTASGRGSVFLNGSSNSLYGWGTGGTARGYMYHNGTNVYLENSTSGNSFNIIQVGAGSINFGTNGATRVQIMSGGGIGMGQSANGTPLRATLVKQGSTSITFTATLNTIGAWRPGHAMIRVSGAQNGLQEYWAAWFFVRLIGYVGNGVATSVLDSGGETGNVSFSSSSDTNSPQTINFILTDSGASTNTMLADIDFAYNEGIVSLT